MSIEEFNILCRYIQILQARANRLALNGPSSEFYATMKKVNSAMVFYYHFEKKLYGSKNKAPLYAYNWAALTK